MHHTMALAAHYEVKLEKMPRGRPTKAKAKCKPKTAGKQRVEEDVPQPAAVVGEPPNPLHPTEEGDPQHPQDSDPDQSD